MKTKLNQSKIKLAIATAIIAGAMGLSATSYAATDTSTMTVSTTVLMSCNISAGAMTFASYDPTLDADSNAEATIDSTCTSGGAAVITMGQGQGGHTDSSDTSPMRQMTAGTEKLDYEVYSDSGRLTEWGNTSATGVSVTGTGSAQSLTAFGKITGLQQVSAVSFTDSVTVTVTY